MKEATLPQIYVCSPLRGDVPKNVQNAADYCREILSRHCIPICAQTMLNGVLDDNRPGERQTALRICRQLVTLCDELWIFGDEITDGMDMEINLAESLEIPIKFFEPDGTLEESR